MKYLLIALIALMFFPLAAQKTANASTLSKKSPLRWRVGLAGHSDNGDLDPYFRVDTEPLAKVQRTNKLQVVADYQLFPSIRSFRLSAEAGLYRIEAGNGRWRRFLALNRFGQPFYESIEMSYLHLGFGLLYEPIVRKRFSPFASMKLQVALPTELQYIVDRPTTDQALVFDRAMINGGAKSAIGWEVSSGLRMQLAPRWITSIGVYYTYMHFESDWPTIELRSFPHGLMRLNTFGLEFGCQYLI